MRSISPRASVVPAVVPDFVRAFVPGFIPALVPGVARALAVALACSAVACASAGTARPEDISAVRFAPTLNVKLGDMQRTTSGVYYADQVAGEGALAQARQLVAVRYTGWLSDGTKIDSSDGLEFRLGTGRVIRAWDDGIEGMRVGGTRTLVVPPELGYGFKDVPGVPRGSVLVFHLQLLRVR